MAEKEKTFQQMSKMMVLMINLTMMFYMFQMISQVLGQVTQAVGGAAPPSGGAPTEQVILEDNFDDDALDTSKWTVYTVGSGSVTETGGVLRCSTSANNDEANLSSRFAYNLIGEIEITVEIKVNNTKTAGLVITDLESGTEDGYRLLIDKYYQRLIVERKINGVPAYWYPDGRIWEESTSTFTGTLKIKLTRDGKIEFYRDGILKYSENFQLGTRNLYVCLHAYAAGGIWGSVDFDNFRMVKRT